MKNIYPNCYDVIPMPTDDGFILFSCDECNAIWLAKYQDVKAKEARCPYCGKKEKVDHFFHQAYHNIFNYYHMVALKNLLGLIGIDIEITENHTVEKNLKYQVQFINIKEPDEKKMSIYVENAFEALKEKAEDNSLEIETKIPIIVQDMINLDEYVEGKMKCCERLLKIKYDKQNVQFCMFCDA